MNRQWKKHAGFSLAESLIAAGVLLVAVSAIALAVNSGHLQLQYSKDARSAVRLAEEIVERVIALPYDDPDGASSPGPEPGESSVSDFDNADDFDGYSESAGQLRDVAGNLHPQAYQHFSRSASAQYDNQTVTGLGDPIPGLVVTVTAQDHKGQTWTLTRFIPE